MSEIGNRIDAYVRLALAQELKREGYRRSGRTFHSVGVDATRVVNMQASQGDAGDDGRLTLNLGVYLPAIAELLRGGRSIPVRLAPIVVDAHGNAQLTGERRTSLPKEYQCTTRTCIGLLLPILGDRWWEIDRGTDIAALSEELAATWTSYGKPWLARFSDLREVLAEAIVRSDYLLATAASIALGDILTKVID